MDVANFCFWQLAAIAALKWSLGLFFEDKEEDRDRRRPTIKCAARPLLSNE